MVIKMVMKKMMMIVLMVLTLVILGCTAPLPETAEEVQQEVVDEGVEENVPEELINEEPVTEAETIVEEKGFQLFNPQLTYPDAYNGPLYGTSEQVGAASMDSYFKNLDRNGINFFIGMFGVSDEPSADALISNEGLGEIVVAAQKHPLRIIPFFNPGIGGEEVEKYLGEDLTGMYTKTLVASQKIVGKDFLRGLGEVETQEWTARHNDPRIVQLINLAQKNNINFMFHPVADKISDVEELIEAYPDTIFLIHMYREDLAESRSQLITILQEHDNLYFSIDAAHILFTNGNDIIYIYDSKDKESAITKFVSTYDSKEKTMVNDAISAYKPLVDAVPDKIMWGTEIGPEYAFDPQVFDRAVKISRLVIAGFNQEHQEAVGYKNALRVFGQGVVINNDIKVLNTNDWPDCTTAQMDACDNSCEITDSDTLTAEQEKCYQDCLIAKHCTEVVEMDVG